MSTAPDRIEFPMRRMGNVSFRSLASPQNVAYFGRTLGTECQQCGAYDQNELGHKYCTHVSCPIALLELKRRRRKRTSSLETLYVPRFVQHAVEASAGEAPK